MFISSDSCRRKMMSESLNMPLILIIMMICSQQVRSTLNQHFKTVKASVLNLIKISTYSTLNVFFSVKLQRIFIMFSTPFQRCVEPSMLNHQPHVNAVSTTFQHVLKLTPNLKNLQTE